jgi:hypothetical protein
MGWQEMAALAVVAATASIFMWRAMRPRRYTFQSAGHCGCSSNSIPPRQSIIFRARKGETPQIVVRNT